MRIVHICLAAFYIDNFGYQENILPRVHHRMGHHVTIVASTETYVDGRNLGYIEPSSYFNEDGIAVHRLAYSRFIPRIVQSKVRAYEGLSSLLENLRPDLIFLHDVQFWDILVIRKYAVKYDIPVHADSHTDFVNSARGYISRYLLHGLYYRFLVRCADPVIRRYFPTLPARGHFMRDVYGLSPDKFTLLPFGVDDTALEGMDREVIREQLRKAMNIQPDDLVFITGGKLDRRKNIHILIDLFSQLRRRDELKNVHLIVFGKPSTDVEADLSAIEIDSNVCMVGWKQPTEIAQLFWAADFALFPGTHSVLWEEAIGHGLGALFHRWPGMDHLDLGGNAIFIGDAKPVTLEKSLRLLAANNGIAVRNMNEIARRKGPLYFAFSRIAQSALK